MQGEGGRGQVVSSLREARKWEESSYGRSEQSLQNQELELVDLETPVSEGFPGGPVLKNPPVMQETQVQSPGWKDSLEEGMAIHSSVLAWQAAIQGVTKSQT